MIFLTKPLYRYDTITIVMKTMDGYREVIVQVRNDHVAKLDEIAHEDGVPRSVLIRKAIVNFIHEKLEAGA